MSIHILICDDDPLSLKINHTYINHLSHCFKLDASIHCFSSIQEKFRTFLQQEKINIAFLDIDMKETNGIVLAQEIMIKNPWAIIIFITSHPEYALDAFNIMAFGYIQKPIEQEHLKKLFLRAIIHAQSIKNKSSEATLDFAYNKRSISIKQTSIKYIEKIQQKIRIVTTDDDYEIYDTITALEQRLIYLFAKIDQGTLINMNYILTLDSNIIRLKTGEIFRIARTQKKKFKEIYSNFPRF
ncbi:LytR/AlgR family response regulator transcription factor [Anaeromicropila populeti]|uniref:Stage 0 sporulation protein A homolog n=1 Tax=Anaeromicropila populeti TaxID=37658 RepID=A0A1I6JCH0_9FIRM|nr:LytTR family DNA-binding domain-containing protein [Anaeromicropila populeti]SFR76614.1 two component transcriptional regulator, LytTR family [Anaeromicropila populeti]